MAVQSPVLKTPLIIQANSLDPDQAQNSDIKVCVCLFVCFFVVVVFKLECQK